MKVLKIAILFIGISSFAQSKVGVVDINYILSKMPEISNVQKQVEAYGAKMDSTLNLKVDQYKKLADEYKTGEATFTDAQKKEKQTAMLNMQSDIQKFQQNGSKLMEIKRNEYLKPLYQKIGVALDKIAKAQGYTQVMQSTDDVVYLDPNYDLTLPILKEMGITVKEETAKNE
jgi:outer membrane protein